VIQPKGFLLVLAFAVWFSLQQFRRSSLLQSLLWLAAGYGSVLGLTGLYFWSRGALGKLIRMNVIWPMQNYSTVNVVPYALGLRQYWSHWAMPIHGVPWLAPLGLLLFAPYLLVAVLPGLVPLLGLPLRRDNLKSEVLLYWLCGWAMWLSEFHRRDIGHLVAGSPLLIILCIHFLTEYRTKISSVALQFLSVSAGALAVVNLFIVLTAISTSTRVGKVAAFKPDPVLAFLDNHVPPGTENFTYPYCPIYYFLSGTENPTRYSVLMYNYNTTSEFQDAIRTLELRKVRYVVWDISFQKNTGHLFAAKSFEPPGGLLMEPYLESHYRVLQQAGGMQIMERKMDDRADSR
jgi:hypothetical protein